MYPGRAICSLCLIVERVVVRIQLALMDWASGLGHLDGFITGFTNSENMTSNKYDAGGRSTIQSKSELSICSLRNSDLGGSNFLTIC